MLFYFLISDHSVGRNRGDQWRSFFLYEWLPRAVSREVFIIFTWKNFYVYFNS